MCSREACIPDSHMDNSHPRTQGVDQSGGATLGCRGLTGAGTGRQFDHTSSELVHPAAPCHTPKRGLVGIRVRGRDVITIRSQSNKERPLIMDV
ncbi:hypothetical protein Tco_0232794 [Tanacetum coccineum]